MAKPLPYAYNQYVPFEPVMRCQAHLHKGSCSKFVVSKTSNRCGSPFLGPGEQGDYINGCKKLLCLGHSEIGSLGGGGDMTILLIKCDKH